MKKPVFLILIGIGVALLVVGVVFVVPWGGKIVNEMETTGELHHQLIRDLEASAREPLTAEQEKLLAQLLEIAEGTDISENPNDLERVLSSEPYLTYLKVLEGEHYEDFSAYIAAMPTPSMRTAARSRIKATFGADKSDEELEIWTNYYFRVREWGIAVEDPHDIMFKLDELHELHQTYLIAPLIENDVEISGLHTQIVQIGMSTFFMAEHTQVFKKIWHERLKMDGPLSGLLWCAIATPTEFGLMRSFFTDMNAFQALFFYRSEPEEHTLAK
ncbi:hypothetical protein C6496_19140 [Candidatus Poribacteria bacterium]|nr:MAG: hypothetical protein C6496_19140 [Candidatus Poribacteria bacterium]